MKYNSFFQLEQQRHRLAANLSLRELKKTYTNRFPEIKNINSAEMWDKLNHNFLDNPMSLDRSKIVKDYIVGKNINVLNVGFGSGNLEKEYFKNKNQNNLNVRWNGIDISENSVSEIMKLYPFAKFKKGDGRELKFESNYFDYVIALEVLEHINPNETFRALMEFHRVLKVNGKLIVSVPLNEGLEEMILKGKNPNGHVRDYTKELITAELIIAGFNLVEYKFLFAFNKFYKFKTFLAKIFRTRWQPNNLILIAKKK